MVCCSLECVGTQNLLQTSAAVSAPCQAWRSCLQVPREPWCWGDPTVSLHPGFLPWEESGQKYDSETQGSISNPCSPLPLSSHCPSLSRKPSSAHRMWPPGTAAGWHRARTCQFYLLHLQGYLLSPGASHWTVVTAWPPSLPPPPAHFPDCSHRDDFKH